MKLDKFELCFLDGYINSFNKSGHISYIEVLPFFKELMEYVVPLKQNISERAKIINDIINNYQDPSKISLNNITDEYKKYCQNNNIKPIQRTTIYNILKNELHYSYRKTTIKTNKIISKDYIKYSLFFLKIFIRAIQIGLNPIFVDESGFYTKNENFYTWRKAENEVFHRIDDSKKINLLMGVSFKNIIKYEIINKYTNSDNFLEFMKELIDSLTNEEKKSSFIILDNCTSHLSPKLFQFYFEQKLKILFNVPYQSTFNMIENCFRFIKNLTYKRLYNNINELNTDVKNINEGNDLKDSGKNLYKETLLVYRNYINSNYNINLNI